MNQRTAKPRRACGHETKAKAAEFDKTYVCGCKTYVCGCGTVNLQGSRCSNTKCGAS